MTLKQMKKDLVFNDKMKQKKLNPTIEGIFDVPYTSLNLDTTQDLVER